MSITAKTKRYFLLALYMFLFILAAASILSPAFNTKGGISFAQAQNDEYDEGDGGSEGDSGDQGEDTGPAPSEVPPDTGEEIPTDTE